MIGNPITNFDFDNNTRVPFAHGMALISDELFEVPITNFRIHSSLVNTVKYLKNHSNSYFCSR